MDIFGKEKRFWIVVGGLVVAVALVVLWGPREALLGSGIRTVYLHVGLIWSGLAGFVLAALCGGWVLWRPRPFAQELMAVAALFGLILYAAGVFMSMIASWDNWGNVFWREPRMAAALNGLAVALIIQVVGSWSPQPRLRAVLHISLVSIVFWLNYRAPRVLHPDNPIWQSDSWRIQLAFVLIGLLFISLGGVLGYGYLQNHRAGRKGSKISTNR
jgi:hypothetical protein